MKSFDKIQSQNYLDFDLDKEIASLEKKVVEENNNMKKVMSK